MEIFNFTPGNSPLLMSIPHGGEYIPCDIVTKLTDAGPRIIDTDWYLDKLYNFAGDLHLNVLKANYSRYVVDLNRAPDNKSLYPGQNVTELVPTSTFAEEPLYFAETKPDKAEIHRRLKTYWLPYHEKITAALSDIKKEYGYVVLFDCHSIKSVVPRFFQGTLPDFNLGTSSGESCAASLRDTLANTLSEDTEHSLAVDGRFKGGYITRHYGDPAHNIHAFQLELSLAAYMNEEPAMFWQEDLAEKVRPTLKRMLESALSWRPKGY